MTQLMNRAFIPIAAGVVVGIVLSATVIQTQPAFLGWLFGVGLGLMGGSFLAAIASGDALIGGPSADGAPSRGGRRGRTSAAPWLDPPEDDR